MLDWDGKNRHGLFLPYAMVSQRGDDPDAQGKYSYDIATGNDATSDRRDRHARRSDEPESLPGRRH